MRERPFLSSRKLESQTDDEGQMVAKATLVFQTRIGAEWQLAPIALIVNQQEISREDIGLDKEGIV